MPEKNVINLTGAPFSIKKIRKREIKNWVAMTYALMNFHNNFLSLQINQDFLF